MIPTIEINATVSLVCSQCGKTIKRQFSLTKHNLETGNYTQRAAYHVECAELEVKGEATRREWKDVEMADNKFRSMCAVCYADKNDV